MTLASYAHGPSEVPLLGDTIGAALRRTVERFGDRDALVVRSQGYRATYRQLWDTVTDAARGLLALGVARGDRVGVWSPNRFEWVVLQYATARIGAILVNINPAYKAAELAYALQQHARARDRRARPRGRRGDRDGVAGARGRMTV
jgi:fatty-acyl-CoA synthase